MGDRKSNRLWFFFLVYGILALLFHAFWLKLGGGDDYYFMTCLDDTDFFRFLAERWNKWSSRILIEGVLVLVLQCPILIWRILDILVSVLIAILSSVFIFHRKEETTVPSVILLLCFFVSYDFRELSSAGWMTTTINYWWTLGAALVASLPLCLTDVRGTYRASLYLFAIPAALFAINHEQICILFLCACIFLLAKGYILKQKRDWYVYFLLILSVLSSISVLICPGNLVRKLSNIEYWFPGYAHFNLVQKILLGWYSLLMTLYKDVNWTYFLFTAVLFLAVLLQKRKAVQVIIAGLPLFSNLGLLGITVLSGIRDVPLFHQILHVFDFDQPIVYYQGFLPGKIRLLLLVYTLCCLCVVLSLFFLWGKTERFIDMLALLVIASASKVSMGLSPTVWASSERTSIFLNFGFLFLGMFCAQDFLEDLPIGKGFPGNDK